MASQIVRTLPASIAWLRSIPPTSAANDGRNARNSTAMVIPPWLRSFPEKTGDRPRFSFLYQAENRGLSPVFCDVHDPPGMAVLQPWRKSAAAMRTFRDRHDALSRLLAMTIE